MYNPNSLIFDYSKLRGRMAELNKTYAATAKAASMSLTTFSQKMQGKGYFTQSQVCGICMVLGIEQKDIGKYFFTTKVQLN